GFTAGQGCPARTRTRLRAEASAVHGHHLEGEFLRLYSGGVRWRWVFSSSNLLPSIATSGVVRAAKDVYCRLLNLIFPEDCHVCGERLREVSRVPVCRGCLTEPARMQAEFFCTS